MDSTTGLKWTMHGTSHGHSILQVAIARVIVYLGMDSTMYSVLSMDIYHGSFLGGGAGIESVSRFQESCIGQMQ